MTMAYGYEHRIQEIIWNNEDYWCIDNDKESKELHEVYRKAKAFNKISDVIKKAEFYDRDTALNIIEIVEDLEDKTK